MSDKNSWKEEYLDLLTNGLNEEAESILALNMPKRLYKYYRIAECSLNNIQENTLWFSNPQFYNDPYDSLIQEYFSFGKFFIENDILSLLTSNINFDREYLLILKNELFKKNRNIKDAVDDFLDYLHQLHDKLSNEDKHHINFLIKKIEAMRIGIYDDKIINSFFEKLYITCFTEIKDDILMWSHYSGSSTGFCVEYDIENFIHIADKEKIDIIPIIYQKELFSYQRYNNCNSPIPQIIVKNKCWKYEQEWRMTSNGVWGEKGIKKCSPKIIKIILGSNFNFSESSTLKDKLISLIKYQDIKLSRMEPEKHTYRLNEYPIRI